MFSLPAQVTQVDPEWAQPGAAANQFLSVRYSDAAISPATARHQLMGVFWPRMGELSISCVNISIQQAPGTRDTRAVVMGRFVVLSVNNN